MKAYVARDEDGLLYVFDSKPIKRVKVWGGNVYILMNDSDLPEGINPQWEDDEPIEVELKIEKKV